MLYAMHQAIIRKESVSEVQDVIESVGGIRLSVQQKEVNPSWPKDPNPPNPGQHDHMARPGTK